MEGEHKINYKNGNTILIGVVVVISLIILFLASGALAGMTLLTIKNRTGELNPSNVLSFASGSLTFPSGGNVTEIGECLDNWLSKNISKSSPFQGRGVKFAEEGKKNNVNPAFLIAIGGAESSYGTDWGAVSKDTFNYAAMTCGTTQKSPCVSSRGNNPRTWEAYDSWDQAIERHAKYMNERYLSRGITNLEEIRDIYCGPIDDCPTWLENVEKVIESITSSCQGLIVQSAFIPIGTGAEKILSIAKHEVEQDYGTRGDCSKYYNSQCVAWCAAFTSWVYKKAGYLDTIEPGTISLRERTKDLRVIKVDGNKSLISPGDIFWMNANNNSGWHVGIVESLGEDGVHTIEGNVGHYIQDGVKYDRLARRAHNYNKIIYVARPR